MKPMDQSSGDPAALKGTRPWTLPFPEENWQRTPAAVQLFIAGQQKTIEVLTKRLDELEARLNRNSSNSDQPSSSDSPYRKATSASKEKRKASGKKGRKGYRQIILEATERRNTPPVRCQCGCCEFDHLKPYYTHQHIELPQIFMEAIHFVLYKGRCRG